ncbi:MULTISPECIES: SRPBCC family protein [Paenibacillus]|uniref:SRPBCC family protein n=1 Tax=Paenibacillus TaxID=44249 RepID=UPI0022B8CD64|nr:SRPBCC family protein [Paenibacillus caseinilyticus]MCZ8521442.1 SRPBCC family protein [Paenibacillus caseinilyticus]
MTYNLTKMIIERPAHEVFEAFVDPERISQFWFSSSSCRWEEGKTVTLRYDEYQAILDIDILEMVKDQRIVFRWGGDGDPHRITIVLDAVEPASTCIEVTEEGFKEGDADYIRLLVDNKEGWVYVLTCLKAYLEFGVTRLRAGLVK